MRSCLLLLLALPAACAPQTPSLMRTGVLAPGGTIAVRNVQGDIDAYAPARGTPQTEYVLWAYAPPDRPKTIVTMRALLISAQAHTTGVRFLVRAPAGCAMDLFTHQGNINVADFEGVVNARTDRGDVRMLIPRYGNASVGTGNLSVIFASTDWPGTLRFTAATGNAEVYVNEKAKARVHLHTGNGTVFSDFNLRGSSRGASETIDGTLNGGGPRSVDVEVAQGSIRLMQLKPQI